MPQLSLHTPVGPLTVSEEDGAIVSVDWGVGRDQQQTALLLEARAQLQDYFDGMRAEFQLPLYFSGTEYRRRVWDGLRGIPFGTCVSYGDLARLVGGSPRSVGGAVGSNPLPILIPCHRVTACASLGGYSGGGGLETKAWLLKHEKYYGGQAKRLEVI